MKLEETTSIVVDGVEVFPIPGWEGLYSISKCGRVWFHRRMVPGRNLKMVPKRARWKKTQLTPNGYIALRLIAESRKKFYLLHRLLAMTFMGLEDGVKGSEVDHADGNSLNNSLSNLRLTDRSGNRRNTSVHRNNKSGYKGVHTSGCKYGKPWRVNICVNGNIIRLGSYDDPVEAAKAYDRAARENFGEFARLNFPSEV